MMLRSSHQQYRGYYSFIFTNFEVYLLIYSINESSICLVYVKNHAQSWGTKMEKIQCLLLGIFQIIEI